MLYIKMVYTYYTIISTAHLSCIEVHLSLLYLFSMHIYIRCSICIQKSRVPDPVFESSLEISSDPDPLF